VRELAELVRELADQGIAVLVSSHQIDELEDVCEHFTILRQGQTVWSGSTEALRRVAPAGEYDLHTSADAVALDLASRRAGLAATTREAGLRLRARPDVLDAFVIDLAAQGIAVRTLAPTLGPLEAMYFSLTGVDAPAAEESPAGNGGPLAPALSASGEVPRSRRARTLSAFTVELRKLSAQLWTRILALICVLGPFAFAAVLKLQNGVPADALFGVWVHSSGYAVSLVILSFAAQWGFPVIAGVVAGDILSGEDRHGTWKTLLTRSRTRSELFAAKVLAVCAMAVAMTVLLALASLVAGLVLIGGHSLVGLSGNLLSPSHSLALVLASWALSLVPLLGYVALGLFVSARSRNGILGVLAPLLAALVMQLLALIGNGAWPHALLLATSLTDWHGLFTSPSILGPVLVGTLVGLAWIAAGLAGSWAALRRRDFASDDASRRVGWSAAGKVVVVGAVLLVLLTLAMSWGPGAITPGRLQASFAPTFSNLTVLQQRWLGRDVPPGAKLDQLTTCQRRAATSTGSGDWICAVNVIIPQAGNPLPVEQTVTYDLSVQSNGCYKAESPPAFVGGQLMQVSPHHSVVNPLYTIYGCFDPL
jgi:ABC-2 type transport system permease protein